MGYFTTDGPLCVLVAWSHLTLCNPVDCNLQGSPAHGILQARILEWVAIPFSGGSSQPRDPTQVSCITGRVFTIWATREVLSLIGRTTNKNWAMMAVCFVSSLVLNAFHRSSFNPDSPTTLVLSFPPFYVWGNRLKQVPEQTSLYLLGVFC